jgi:hypothetical protein
MNKKVLKLFYPAILLIIMKFFASCTPSACLGETTSFINATFYKTGTDIPFKPDSVTIFGTGMESKKLYYRSANISSIKLPLNASSGTCGFVMKINKLTDTLEFSYSNYPHLISKECGYTFFFTIMSCKWYGSVIDTINIRNPSITIFNEENIRIFY